MKTAALLLTVFCLLSCQGRQAEKETDFTEVWTFEAGDSHRLIAECVDSVSYLPLRLAGDALIRNIDKMVFKNGLMYIGDFRTRKIVACDREGNCLFTLNRYGAGEGEYQEIKSFTVTEKYIYVLDNYRHKAYLYDAKTGQYAGRKDLPVTAWDIGSLSADRFLLAFVPMHRGELAQRQERHLIFVTDGDFNILQSIYPYDETYAEPLGLTCYFTADEDYVYFTSFRFDGVTVFPKTRPEDHYRIGIGFEYGLSADERSDSKKMRESRANYLSATPFFCGDFVSLDIAEGEYSFTCLYNRKDSTFYHNPSDESMSAFNALMPPTGSHENRLISVIPGDEAMYRDLVNAGFKKASPAIEEQIRNGDFILLLYTMRQPAAQSVPSDEP